MKRAKSEILQNIKHLGLGDLSSRLFSFVAFLYLARTLGPDLLGLIGFGASAAALLVPVIDYGLGFVGTREVSRNPSSLNYYIKSIVFDRFLLAMFSMVSLAGVAIFLIGDPEKTRILLLYALTLVPAIVSLTWAYQGIGRTGWFLLEKNVQSILYCVGVYVFVRRNEDFQRVPIAYLMSALIPALCILVYLILRYRAPSENFSIRGSIGLLKSSFKLFVPILFSQVNVALGLLFVVYLSTLREAGYYSASSRLIVLSAVIPNLLWSSFYPGISRTVNSENDQLRSLVSILYKYAVVIGIVPVFLGIAYGKELVALLFGNSYEGGLLSFIFFSMVASLQYVSIVFTRILPAMGREKTFSLIVVGGIAIQIAAGFALIPHYGALGAALSFMLSEAYVAIAALRIMHTTIGIKIMKYPVTAIAAIVLCYAVVWLIRFAIPIPMLISGVMVTIFYFALLFASSIISLGDFYPHETLAI